MGLPTLLLAVLGGIPRRSTPDPEKNAGRHGKPEEAGVVSDDEQQEEEEEEEGVRPPRHRNLDFSSRTISIDTSMRPPQSLSVKFTRTNTTDTTLSTASAFSRAREFFFPREDPALLDRFVPNYRLTPIISGVVIPFSILLEIPGLTERWYIRTENHKTVETKPNPPILDIGMAFSISCALIANVCLVLRFLEKRVRTTTLLCIVFLTIHGAFGVPSSSACY